MSRRQSIAHKLQEVKKKVKEEVENMKEIMEESGQRKEEKKENKVHMTFREKFDKKCSIEVWKTRAVCYIYAYRYRKCCCGLGDLSLVLLAGACVIFMYDLYLAYTNMSVLKPDGWNDPLGSPVTFLNKSLHPCLNTFFSALGIYGVALYHIMMVKIFAQWLVFTAGVRIAFITITCLIYTVFGATIIQWARVGEQIIKVFGSIWLAQLNWAFQILVRKKVISAADPTGRAFARSGIAPGSDFSKYIPPSAHGAVDARHVINRELVGNDWRGNAAERRGSAVDRRNSSVGSQRRNSSVGQGARKGSAGGRRESRVSFVGSVPVRQGSQARRNSSMQNPGGGNKRNSSIGDQIRGSMSRRNSSFHMRRESMTAEMDAALDEGIRVVCYALQDPSSKLPTAEETDIIITDGHLSCVSLATGIDTETVIHQWMWELCSKCFLEFSDDEDLMDVFSFAVEDVGEFSFECDRPDAELLMVHFKNGVEFKAQGKDTKPETKVAAAPAVAPAVAVVAGSGSFTTAEVTAAAPPGGNTRVMV
jgi:hypothetical protein